jgi:hypothetical protein
MPGDNDFSLREATESADPPPPSTFVAKATPSPQPWAPGLPLCMQRLTPTTSCPLQLHGESQICQALGLTCCAEQGGCAAGGWRPGQWTQANRLGGCHWLAAFFHQPGQTVGVVAPRDARKRRPSPPLPSMHSHALEIILVEVERLLLRSRSGGGCGGCALCYLLNGTRPGSCFSSSMFSLQQCCSNQGPSPGHPVSRVPAGHRYLHHRVRAAKGLFRIQRCKQLSNPFFWRQFSATLATALPCSLC